MNEPNRYIKSSAKDRGFSLCGITNIVNLSEQKTILQHWLENECHGSMNWFVDTIDKRVDPTLLLEGAKSVIVCALSNSCSILEGDFVPLASYSMRIDYHYQIKKMLQEVLDDLKVVMGDVSGLCFVDSAPVLEKYWAQRAGLGWIGKNSLLTSPLYGSMLNLGVILIDKEMDCYDTPIKNRCGTCTRCVDCCPGGALTENPVDSRRCFSYLTIEYRGEFDDQQLELFKNSSQQSAFGCDRCQQVCPWNELALKKNGSTHLPDKRFFLSKEQWLKMGIGEFRREYKTTPLMRCGLKQIKRNIRAFSEE